MKRSNALLSEMWVTMKNTARWQLTSSALHGFMSALSTAYGYAQDLNESLTNIRIVTSKSTEEMEAYASAANKAAAALNTTTTNYTDASLIYYQQGLDDEAVQARTEATVKLANVTSQSAETVSEQLTAIWNNFAEGSDNLEYYADVITALGASTASSSAEISEGLSKFASVATTVGLSYEYATSALATVVAETR
jgi:TP901 family phage tail tape measure protein